MLKNKATVAAFDFDGTITRGDSLLPFLQFTSGKWKALGRLILESPILLGFLLGLIPRQKSKEHILSCFYKGMPHALLQSHGTQFAQTAINKILRPEAMQRIAWHKKQNHRCILISASIDVYLRPWAQLVGFQDVISSQLETGPDGLLTGKIIGANCWGPEKVKRLEELLGNREDYIIHAYGNSRGDKELLEYADFPHFKRMPISGALTECIS